MLMSNSQFFQLSESEAIKLQMLKQKRWIKSEIQKLNQRFEKEKTVKNILFEEPSIDYKPDEVEIETNNKAVGKFFKKALSYLCTVTLSMSCLPCF